MTTGALPKAHDVAVLLKDLLGRPVTAKDSKLPVSVAAPWKGVITEFLSPEHTLAALLVTDLALACHSSAAMMLIPAPVAASAVKAGAITEPLLENYYEVANILTALYRPYDTRMIRGRLFTSAAGLPPEVTELLAHHVKHLSVDVDVSGYGAGRLTLVGH